MILNGREFWANEYLQTYLHPEYVLNWSTTGIDRPTYLLLVIATISYAWSYCLDKDSGYLEQVVGRVGIRAYSVSKAIATAVSAFLACIIAMAIYTIFLYSYFQGQDPIGALSGVAYLDTAGAGKTGLYFLCVLQ